MPTLRTKRVLASFTVLALVPGLTALSLAGPATAAPPPVDPAVTAATSVDTLAADVLGLTLPFPLGSLTAASLDLGDVNGTVNGVNPRATAHAANLGLDAVGIPLGGILSSADQSAPPDNPAAATGLTIPAIAVPPVLSAGISNSTAHARWTADNTCLAAGTPLTSSSTTTANASLLDLPVVGPLLSLPGEVTTSQSVSLESLAGGTDARRVVGQTRSTLVQASLFGSIGVGVSEAAVLTATASGQTGGALVTYSEPVVTLTNASLPDGAIVLDAANDTATFVLPENPLLSLEVSLGTLARTEAADGTSATGSTALLHVRLFVTLGQANVATVDLVPMSATATAPAGGIECGEADTSTFVTVTVPEDGAATGPRPTFSGTKEPGASVVVTDASGDVVCSTTADATGAWSCTPSSDLEHGSQTYSATATDAAGNTAVDTTTFAVVAPEPGDTTAPAAPVITSPTDGSTTTDTTPTVTGTAEPGSTVTVTEGGIVCTAVANGAGNWTCTPTTPLGVGPHTLSATAADAAGNTSSPDTATFTVTAPGNPDLDGDGLLNVAETPIGTDPLDPDTDDDGLTDGAEVLGMTIKERFEVCGKRVRKSIRVTTNPLVKDTDRDGLGDGLEVKGYSIRQVVFVTRSGQKLTIGKTRSNPTKADTDRDGIKDKAEKTGSANKSFQRRKSDPSKCDTDRGGISDGREVKLGSDPTRIKSGPNDLE